MPELPEVETVVRGLRPKLEGRRLAGVEQRCQALRFPLPQDFARRLTGRRVTSITRRAKYILVHLDDGEVLICHLGMSGRMVVEQPGRKRAGRWKNTITSSSGPTWATRSASTMPADSA